MYSRTWPSRYDQVRKTRLQSRAFCEVRDDHRLDPQSTVSADDFAHLIHVHATDVAQLLHTLDVETDELKSLDGGANRTAYMYT